MRIKGKMRKKASVRKRQNMGKYKESKRNHVTEASLEKEPVRLTLRDSAAIKTSLFHSQVAQLGV